MLCLETVLRQFLMSWFWFLILWFSSLSQQDWLRKLTVSRTDAILFWHKAAWHRFAFQLMNIPCEPNATVPLLFLLYHRFKLLSRMQRHNETRVWAWGTEVPIRVQGQSGGSLGSKPQKLLVLYNLLCLCKPCFCTSFAYITLYNAREVCCGVKSWGVV